MANKVRLYWTNYKTQDEPPTFCHTSGSPTHLFSLLVIAHHKLKPGVIFCITLHILHFPVRGKPHHWLFLKLADLVSSSRGETLLHPACHRIYWCWTQSQWIPLLVSASGEGMAGKAGTTIDESPWCVSGMCMSSLGGPTVRH